MRCPDVKRRIDAGTEEFDQEMIEHLQTCPGCTRALQAARAMRGVFSTIADDITVPPLAVVRKRVEHLAQNEAQKSIVEKIMAHLSRQYQARPRLITGFGLALVAFLFVTLVPFSYEQAVGDKITIDSADTQPSPEVVTAVLSTASKEGVTVISIAAEDDTNLVIVDIPSEIVARQVVSTLAKVIDSRIKPQIERNIVAVTGSLFAQARQIITADEPQRVKMRFDDGKIVLNGQAIHDILHSTELSDKQIQTELEKAFAAFGIAGDGVDIKVITHRAQSTRTVTIALDEQHAESDKQGIVELHMGANEIWAKFDDSATAGENGDYWNIRKVKEQKDSNFSSAKFQMDFPNKSLKGHTIIMHIDL